MVGFVAAHPSSKERSMDGAQFHLPWVSSSVGFISRGSEAPVPDQEELALQAPGDATLIRKML